MRITTIAIQLALVTLLAGCATSPSYKQSAMQTGATVRTDATSSAPQELLPIWEDPAFLGD